MQFLIISSNQLATFISENVDTLKDIWFAGDLFLREIYNGLLVIRTAARVISDDHRTSLTTSMYLVSMQIQTCTTGQPLPE